MWFMVQVWVAISPVGHVEWWTPSDGQSLWSAVIGSLGWFLGSSSQP